MISESSGRSKIRRNCRLWTQSVQPFSFVILETRSFVSNILHSSVQGMRWLTCKLSFIPSWKHVPAKIAQVKCRPRSHGIISGTIRCSRIKRARHLAVLKAVSWANGNTSIHFENGHISVRARLRPRTSQKRSSRQAETRFLAELSWAECK